MSFIRFNYRVATIFLVASLSSLFNMCLFSQSIFDNSSCATAKLLCSGRNPIISINENYENGILQPVTPPAQYVKMKFSASSTIYLYSEQSGTYSLYGPFSVSDQHLDNCQLITLGLVQSVSGAVMNSNSVSIPTDAGFYILKLQFNNYSNNGGVNNKIEYSLSLQNTIGCKGLIQDDCKDCLKTFSPPSGKYIVSAWVKGEAQNRNSSYLNPFIKIGFNSNSAAISCSPSGPIIDEWQRIDTILTIPADAVTMQIELGCTTGTCYFDDFRFYPLDGSLVTYVYDPINLRLVAQLDERNFATLYDYDEEGQLKRVKKETERGIMTIQENSNNIKK